MNAHLLLKPLITLLSLYWCPSFRSWSSVVRIMRNREFLGGPAWTAQRTAGTTELPAPLPWVCASCPAWSQGAQSLTGQASQRGIWDVVTTSRAPPPQRVSGTPPGPRQHRALALAQAVTRNPSHTQPRRGAGHVGLHGTTFPGRLGLGLGYGTRKPSPAYGVVWGIKREANE